MLEQQNLFSPDADTATQHTPERGVYEILLPSIAAACNELNIPIAKIRFREGAEYSSVYYADYLIMQLRMRGKSNYISVPKSWLPNLPTGIEWIERKSDNGRIRITIRMGDVDSAMAIGRAVTRAAILHIPHEFDCCSRYEQCSDAKKCIHPDPEFALLCGYRKILASGRVFYGKNRNV